MSTPHRCSRKWLKKLFGLHQEPKAIQTAKLIKSGRAEDDASKDTRWLALTSWERSFGGEWAAPLLHRVAFSWDVRTEFEPPKKKHPSRKELMLQERKECGNISNRTDLSDSKNDIFCRVQLKINHQIGELLTRTKESGPHLIKVSSFLMEQKYQSLTTWLFHQIKKLLYH